MAVPEARRREIFNLFIADVRAASDAAAELTTAPEEVVATEAAMPVVLPDAPAAVVSKVATGSVVEEAEAALRQVSGLDASVISQMRADQVGARGWPLIAVFSIV